jgi:hypothetical protein
MEWEDLKGILVVFLRLEPKISPSAKVGSSEI